MTITHVFPQGFAAIADRLAEFKGTTMLCDIGNGTMNIMTITDGKPDRRAKMLHGEIWYAAMRASYPGTADAEIRNRH